MRRLFGVFIFLIASALGASSAQAPPQRIALVIGNGAYQRPAWVLANPPRDADLIAQRLSSLGFEVDLVKNADREAMQAAFTRFGQRLRAGGKTAEGVFYYAGHGAQQDGVNYLVPVDATARTADQLRFQAPAMQFLLDDMAAVGNAVNLIVLDACRDMPLEQGFRSTGGGLADTGKLPNIFIAYAAAPGRTAADGGGANSPFTATLAKFLVTEPGETIGQLFADVNAAVYTATSGAQSPEYRNGLVRAPRWSFRLAGVDGAQGQIRATTGEVSRPKTAPRDLAFDSSQAGREAVRKRLDEISQTEWNKPPSAMALLTQVTPNEADFHYLVEIADTGHLRAREAVAEMKFFGFSRFVGKDVAGAVAMFRAAAEAGEPHAQLFLGIFRMRGEYGEKADLKDAVRLFKSSAAQGCLDAAAYLAVMYAGGSGGLPRDLDEAERLLTAASEAGSDLAKQYLPKVRDMRPR